MSNIQIIEIEFRLHIFENLYKKYDVLQSDLEALVDDPSEQYAEREEFENEYYSLLAIARLLINNARSQRLGESVSEVTPGTNDTNNHNSINLPKIDFPKFSGSFHDGPGTLPIQLKNSVHHYESEIHNTVAKYSWRNYTSLENPEDTAWRGLRAGRVSSYTWWSEPPFLQIKSSFYKRESSSSLFLMPHNLKNDPNIISSHHVNITYPINNVELKYSHFKKLHIVVLPSLIRLLSRCPMVQSNLICLGDCLNNLYHNFRPKHPIVVYKSHIICILFAYLRF